MSNKNTTGQFDIGKFQERLKNPKTTMTEEMLEDLRKKVYESLSIDRQKLLMRQPFTGGMLMRMEFVPIRDYRCNTAMTDGSRIYFDIDFYKNLNEDERKFVLAHEIWHVIYMHFLRKQNRFPELWNIATDCEINYMLKNEGFHAPEHLCFPEREDEGKNAEEIYEHLLKKAKKNSKSGKDKKNNSSDGNGNGDGQSGSGSKSKNNKNSSGSGNGRLTGQFDKHVDKNGENGDQEGQNGEGDGDGMLPTDQWGEKGEDPNYTPRIDQDAAEKIREMVISEAQRYERTQGKLPSSLESIVNKLRTPEINWREYLSQFVTRCLGDKRVWLPPNRHHVWSGSYFQSRRSDRIQVIVTVDTSGSTTADLPKFMTELVSLLNTFGGYEMTLVQCDAEVHDITTYDDSNEFPVDNPETVKWKGFGGSDLRPAFEEIAKRGIEASMHIVFTDGYITCPEKNPLGIPTLFILTSDGDKNVTNWGEKVRFKEKVGSED